MRGFIGKTLRPYSSIEGQIARANTIYMTANTSLERAKVAANNVVRFSHSYG